MMRRQLNNWKHRTWSLPQLQLSGQTQPPSTPRHGRTLWQHEPGHRTLKSSTRLKTWEFDLWEDKTSRLPNHIQTPVVPSAHSNWLSMVEPESKKVTTNNSKPWLCLPLLSLSLPQRLDCTRSQWLKMQLSSPERRAPQVFQESVVPISVLILRTAYLNLPGTTGRSGGWFCSNHLLLELPLTDQKRKKKHVNTATDTLQWLQGRVFSETSHWRTIAINSPEKKERTHENCVLRCQDLDFHLAASIWKPSASTPQLSLTGPFSIIWQKLSVFAASEPIANIFLPNLIDQIFAGQPIEWKSSVCPGGILASTRQRKSRLLWVRSNSSSLKGSAKHWCLQLERACPAERNLRQKPRREPHLMRHLTHMLRPLTKLGDEFHNLAHSLKP